MYSLEQSSRPEKLSPVVVDAGDLCRQAEALKEKTVAACRL